MKRRELIKSMGLAGAGFMGMDRISAVTAGRGKIITKELALTVAHITDVHIRDGDNAPERFTQCLKQITGKHHPDFFLNGGDSINDASYNDVKRESVIRQWKIWDDCIGKINRYELFSCIGNHDPWWSAPSKEDAMYGKPYVVNRLKIPYRYYSFSRKGWHFIILDGNNSNISLDEEQFQWLEKELNDLPASTPTLIMSHYPILGTTQVLVGGGHSDCKKLKGLFYRHRDKVKICLSGHNHLSDKTLYNNVYYCCNGAMSGYWWGKGDAESAGPGYYLETPPGYAILKLFKDGSIENEYISHNY